LEVGFRQIIKPDSKPLQTENAGIMMPPQYLPSFRLEQATERGVARKVLIECWGGLGDIIVAEPAIRWAIENFDGFEFSVETWFPELFQHLGLKKIYNTTKERADKTQYHVFKSMYPTPELVSEFVRYAGMQRVDYCAMALWGRQLPIEDRQIRLAPTLKDMQIIPALQVNRSTVVLHPGRTWQTRTMPKDWWDPIVKSLVSRGLRPLIIGAEWTDGKRGTVPIEVEGCLDVRGKLSMLETVAVLQGAGVVLTNDSAPLHMAASGDAWIGFLSTVNEPFCITHWRDGKWGHKMHDFAKGGMYQVKKTYPDTRDALFMNEIDDSIFRSWLPSTEEIVEWTMEKL
jgi:ADP-heptose:LPS heptosyltransferase